jgi:hypothetical protein
MLAAAAVLQYLAAQITGGGHWDCERERSGGWEGREEERALGREGQREGDRGGRERERRGGAERGGGGG